MKKCFLLILITIVLSGCNATYNLEIKNNKFKERIFVSIDNNDSDSVSYFKNEKFYAIMTGVSDFKTYDKKIKTKQNITDVKLAYDYHSLDYLNSTALSSCFDAYNVIDEKGYYIISTSKGLKCGKEENTVLLDNLKIVIQTNHKVKENNAQDVDGYTYIWTFDSDNYDDASIYIKLYKDKYVFNYKNEFYKKIALYICVPAVLIVTITLFIIYISQKKKKVNKV